MRKLQPAGTPAKSSIMNCESKGSDDSFGSFGTVAGVALAFCVLQSWQFVVRFLAMVPNEGP